MTNELILIQLWAASLKKRLQYDAKLSRPPHVAYLHFFEAIARGIAKKC